WKKLIDNYFSINKNIMLAIHIIDSRHDPMQPDLELYDFLHAREVPYFLLMNKSDKLKQSELATAKRNVSRFFPDLIPSENILLYSTIKGTGKREIVKLLSSLFLI
ncbi:MAG: YihA family ribosome biogenesis GTP-binding protein, partial [Ignavibacteriae bacterium HGW-Ignavibacteriae-3]